MCVLYKIKTILYHKVHTKAHDIAAIIKKKCQVADRTTKS